MREILKPIFEWLTGNYYLFDNVVYNYVAMASIGVLAFVIAWKFVGILYDNGLIRGREVGSIIHWCIRFIAFVIIFTVVSIIIWLVKLILSIPIWVWIVLVVILAIIIYTLFLKKSV